MQMLSIVSNLSGRALSANSPCKSAIAATILPPDEDFILIVRVSPHLMWSSNACVRVSE